MSNKKQYRLLKALPFMKAETIYSVWDEEGKRHSYLPNVSGCKHERFAIHADYVENNPEWFEEIKPERIQVTVFSESGKLSSGSYHYFLCTTQPVPREQYGSIKKAIEGILNNESQIEQIKEQAEKEAFDRSRVFELIKNNIGGFEPKYMYPTFEDYKKSKS